MSFLRRHHSPIIGVIIIGLNSILSSCAAGRTYTSEGLPLTRNNIRLTIDKVYNLGGRTVCLGANDTLVFKGGVFVNGVIIGNETYVEAPDKPIFQMVTLSGSWDVNTIAYPEWFGAMGDGVTDDAMPIQLALDSFRKVRLGKKKYATSKIIQVHSNTEFYGAGNRSVLYNIVNSGFDKSEGCGQFPDICSGISLLRKHLQRGSKYPFFCVVRHNSLHPGKRSFHSHIIVNERSPCQD